MSAAPPDGEKIIEINESPQVITSSFEDMSLFYCPHCHNVLENPVVAICGHSYCSKCYPNVEKCTLDDQSLKIANFSPPQNAVLISVMNRVMTPCRFHCGHQIPIVKLNSHGDSCPALRKTPSAQNLLAKAALNKSSNTVPERELSDFDGERLPKEDQSVFIDFSEISLKKKVGEGFFGAVYKADFRSSPVAVKIVRVHTEEARITFQEEVQIVKSLRHPDLVLFIAACITTPNECIVSEFMNRGTLRKALDSNQEIELYTRIKWASQATRGLAYLHGCQVIHRDFKSNNLLLDRGWNCKVSDFGLSRVAESGLKFQAGNAFWAAPEVVKGEKYDLSADIFSLGIVFIELLTRADPSDFEAIPRKKDMSVDLEVVSKKIPQNTQKWLDLASHCLSLKTTERPTAPKVVAIIHDIKSSIVRGSHSHHGNAEQQTQTPVKEQ